MRKIVGLFRFASTYVRLVRDTDRLDLVFALADSVDESPGLRRMLGRPEVKAYLARPLPPLQLELADLRALPEGSLGREFARFLDERKLDPTGVYHSALDTSDDTAQLKRHLERSHDLWHTVLGFDTDVAGELGLQAFYIAQLQSPLGHLLLSAGLLNGMLFNHEDGDRRMEAITRGWRLGKATRPLFGADWAAMLTWPIEQVREHFGITPEHVRTAAMAA
ncbi:Ubiquinone biosynthesis protein Coq4 [Nannocystis exedens]|uniref:Ubiquinone biosynthesis protein Coq4 n=1 Tax=Nannocystis exedens TaxID=54 RepID=A0A1I2EQI1_9BACT|nr:Coq4 family protein [Nannocystis exedens]PCC73866.1 Coenzyme Q (ubiquinone) biosynthesis protein Coq4 [Nannocystis exedens]SFE95079.1 Ubiquinone biosynthesis protein Coq4 [Nannocystis exedens]